MNRKITNFRDLDVWQTQIEIAWELKYMASAAKGVLLEKLDHETHMLRNLVKKLG